MKKRTVTFNTGCSDVEYSYSGTSTNLAEEAFRMLDHGIRIVDTVASELNDKDGQLVVNPHEASALLYAAFDRLIQAKGLYFALSQGEAP